MTHESPQIGRCVSLLLALGLVAAGCGRAPTPGPPDTAPARLVNTAPPGLIRYEQSVFPGEVGPDPNRIAVDRAGNLYVAGRTGLRVLDAAGRLVRAWSTPGPAISVAVGESGRVYVGLARRIEVYGPDGARITSWGEAGDRETGRFGLISGLAVSEPDVFVADSGKRCIHHFAMNGDFVADIARRDPLAGEPGLLVPSPYLDCLAAPDGSLMLTDPGRRTIQHRTADGRRLGEWGDSGLAPGRFAGCCNPIRIAWVSKPIPGVVTVEKGTRRVQVFARDGRLTGYIAPNRFAKGTAPLDVVAADDGRLLVLDPEVGRVLVFRPVPGESARGTIDTGPATDRGE